MNDRNWLTRTGNPGLNDRTFASLPRVGSAGERMTLQGTINKSFLMLLVLLGGALWPWSQYLSGGNAAQVTGSLIIGGIAGFVLALIISFKQTTAPYLALPYAACEGLAIGALSAVLERRYPGIAIQAVGLTFAVMAALLLGYTTRLIRVTARLRAIVFAGTMAIALLYLVTAVLGMFHVPVAFMTGASALSVGISLVIIGFAALNLVVDFDLIETGVAQGAPRYMEWFAAFGLLVTLVWMYMEILRLLGNLRQR
jgi:uncharacterized YccA/Bax inhibitor family protein